MDREIKLVVPPTPKTKREKVLDLFVMRSWWVLLFAAGCYLLYSQGMHKKREAYLELVARSKTLEAEKKRVLEEQEDLLLQINSQNDPAWIEMTLLKKVGMVPEGQVKVYFE
jgi:hypothetical protein